jgi:hypothetical protein
VESVVGQKCLSEFYIYPSVERFFITFGNKLQYENEYYTSGLNSFPHGSRATNGQALLIIKASHSHSDTPHSVGLFWTSDQPVAETTWQHTTSQETDIHAPGRIRTGKFSKQAAARTVSL